MKKLKFGKLNFILIPVLAVVAFVLIVSAIYTSSERSVMEGSGAEVSVSKSEPEYETAAGDDTAAKVDEAPGGDDAEAPDEASADVNLPVDSSFWVEFVDVGQGDCALIRCDGHYMLIDGGPSSASRTVYSVLKNKDVTELDLMVATHPDADHIGGLSGALNYAHADLVLSPVSAHDTKAFNSLEKYVKKQGNEFTIPSPGDEYELGSAKVSVLGPVSSNDETNNLSIVIKVTYGKNSFLFMGDAQEEEESDILRRSGSLSCDVIKIGHHGSSSSTSSALLKAAVPSYAVISVGSDNTYGHPTAKTLKKLVKAGIAILRTDLQGDIVFESDGKNVTVMTEKEASEEELETPGDEALGGNLDKTSEGLAGGSAEGTVGFASNSVDSASADYVLNKNSKKFHLPECDSVGDMSAKNRQDVTMSREEIIAMGYIPCKRCNP